jgi:hypothetical protein
MNKQFFLAVNAIAAAAVLASGCASTSPRFDSHFGESVRTVTAQQVLNPEAGTKPVPDAIEGTVARQTISGYRSSFRDPQATQNAFTIGLGGNSSGGGGSR